MTGEIIPWLGMDLAGLVITLIFIIGVGALPGYFIYRRIRWYTRFKLGYTWWYRTLSIGGDGPVWHRCGICDTEISDVGSGFFQDYVCPIGHYEFHFDCGCFNCRVGDKHFKFDDEVRTGSYEAMNTGLAQVKQACRDYKEMVQLYKESHE